MSVLAARDYYKPFDYIWAFEAFEKAFDKLHWGPEEAPMADDIDDWKKKLTVHEQNLLTQLFRFFTQADVDIAGGYAERYLRRFKKPELRMMLGSFIAQEANHIRSYATLIETLGIPEVEFKAFLDYEDMRAKHDYMHGREIGTSITDLAIDLAIFSAFGEGLQLFSSFALLMSFQKRGLMKGMTTIIEWSIRDETLHVESMIRLFHELIKDHPRAWNDETKKAIYDACRRMVELEDHFIDLAFALIPPEFYETLGVSPEKTKQYIRYLADRRLMQLGLKPNYGVTDNPFDWLDELTNLKTHTNFFEQRSTEYTTGGMVFGEAAFDFSRAEPMESITGLDFDGILGFDPALPEGTFALSYATGGIVMPGAGEPVAMLHAVEDIFPRGRA